MKINFLGDSITEGAFASLGNDYVTLVGKILGCEVKNYGISGTRIAKKRVPSEVSSFDEDFQKRAPLMEDADIVFVFGGTNDWGHGDAPLGDVSDTDAYTFCGGVNNLITILNDKYKGKKIVFILPIQRFDGDGNKGEFGRMTDRPPMSEFIKKEQAILQKRGVRYINLNELGMPAPLSMEAGEYYADGLHPNDKGHKLLAEIISSYIKTLL